MGDERKLTEQEAAQFIGLTVHTLRKWRWKKQDGPPYLKLGSCVRYRLQDLYAYIESHLVDHAKSRKVEPRSRRRARRAA